MEKTMYNVKDLVKLTAEKAGKTQKEVNYILECMDAAVKEELSVAGADKTVEVKILPSGLSLIADYVEPHQARNPATGETVSVDAKIRIKGKVYTGIKNAVNA